MNILALDTTSHIASAALIKSGAVVRELFADASKKHAETVVPLIARLLGECGVSLEQIDLFAVDIGPGSFTGVRIGVSTINAMAFARGLPVVGVDALYTLSAMSGETTRPVCAMIDARNGNAYAALYQGDETLLAPCAVSIDPFCAALPADALIIGDVSNAAIHAYPRAGAVGLAAAADVLAARESVEPLYLRASQAERLRDTKRTSGEA